MYAVYGEGVWEVFINSENELIESINRLEITMSGFSAKMLEFKAMVEKRLDELDNRQTQCQVNPSVCANARKLEEHIKNDNSRTGRITGIIGCVISCISVFILILGKLN